MYLVELQFKFDNSDVILQSYLYADNMSIHKTASSFSTVIAYVPQP